MSTQDVELRQLVRSIATITKTIYEFQATIIKLLTINLPSPMKDSEKEALFSQLETLRKLVDLLLQRSNDLLPS